MSSFDEGRSGGKDHSAADAQLERAKRRRLKLNGLQEAIAEVERLDAGGYRQAGSWGLAGNLSHLNKSLNLCFEPFPFITPAPIRPIMRAVMVPLMKRCVQFPAGFKAPPPLQPAEDLELAAEIAEFKRLVGAVLNPDSQLQPNHPLLGKFNREQWIIMQTWHAAHHLSFLVPK